MKARVVRGRLGRRGGSGAGALLGFAAAVGGVALLVGAGRKQEQRQESTRLQPGELPSVSDFQKQLEALGIPFPGDEQAATSPPRLEQDNGGVRVEVIDTTATPAPVPAG